MSREKLQFAVVCSSNQNRSMEAHDVLQKNGFNIRSYGSGNQVKLPGTAADKPNVYDFGTPYDDMYKDLESKDHHLYKQIGILHMLDRNRRIKPCPERFQTCQEKFDVVFTCEERVYDQVIEELSVNREPETTELTHVINMDIQDNHEEATVGAFKFCELARRLAACDDLENEIDEVLTEFEVEHKANGLLHTVVFK